MANLSKERRDRMIAKLEELKRVHNDDASISALNEIENALREKKYGLVWEEHSENVDDMLKENIPVLIEDTERRICKDPSLPWNFIIEGDNLQALYLLEKTHRGKVDCIYIDPPYNTGARDWKYNNDYVDGNDEYRHSKWLSMMKGRLSVAKRLLNPNNSVLIVTIDEKEYVHLGCLLEEMFPDAKIQMVSSVIRPSGMARETEFSRANEYIYFLRFGDCVVKPLPLAEEWKGNISGTTTNSVRWQSLMRGGSNSERSHSPGCFYPIYISLDKKHIVGVGDPLPLDVDYHTVELPKDVISLFPVRPDGDERVWQYSPAKFMEIQQKGYVRLSTQTRNEQGVTIRYISDGWQKRVEKNLIKVLGRNEDGSLIFDNEFNNEFIPPNQWWIKSHNATDQGSKLLQTILGARFPYPKSLYAVHDTIRFFIDDKPDALVLDFFAGSGTTLHAVNLLNAEDGGHRKCIMVTNNELSEAEQKDFESRGIHKGDEEWENRGIARYVTWPRTVCSINGVNINGEPLKGEYIGSDIPMSEGFISNVKFFKCDWTPRKPDEYLLANALCVHVKEMIELQTAEEIDGIKNVLILNRNDYKRAFETPEIETSIERVWVNENLIFSAEEMRKIRTKKFRYVPREFFSQELKEVGEYV